MYIADELLTGVVCFYIYVSLCDRRGVSRKLLSGQQKNNKKGELKCLS